MIDRTTVAAGVIVLALILAGFVILSVRGVGTVQYALFLGGPLVTTLVGYVLSQRAARVEAVVKKVEHQTNSLLTGKLAALGDQLDAAVFDRAEKATTGGEPQTSTRNETKL